jgi:tol-pal system protein YbgF
MRRQLFCGVSVVLGLVAAAPAEAQSRREMQMMADIRMLQEQTQQLQQQLAAALAQIGESLNRLSTRIDDQNTVARKGFADQKLTIDQLGSDLRIVKERVDESNVRITSLSQEVEALRIAIPTYPPATMSATPTLPVDPGQASVTPPVTGASGTPAPADPGATTSLAPATPVAPGISPQRLFDTAWTDFSVGQWTLCVEGFNQYLRAFPRSEMAGEAQFYIGECYYSDGKYTEAGDAYNRVIANHGRSLRAPEAYYKLGLTFERMGQLDRARQSWEALIKTFPDSDIARLSKQNLDRLARGKGGF